MSISTLSPGVVAQDAIPDVGCLVDVVAVDADDDVAGLQAGVVGRRAGHDLGDEGALVDRRLEGRLDVVGHVGQLRRRHAQERLVGVDLALAGLQLLDDRLGVVDRDREADVLGIVDDRRVDADDLAVGVDQRAAGVAGVDGGVGLDQAVELLALGGRGRGPWPRRCPG